MAEQIALDQGRTTMGMLLSALSHPNWGLLQRRRCARLASANWIAANVAFLMDVDYLETRLKAAGTQSQGSGDQAPLPRRGPLHKGLLAAVAKAKDRKSGILTHYEP